MDSCRNHDYTDLIVVHEHRGEPDGLVICHLPYGPTAYFGLFNTVRRVVWRGGGGEGGPDGHIQSLGGRYPWQILLCEEGRIMSWLPALLQSKSRVWAGTS